MTRCLQRRLQPLGSVTTKEKSLHFLFLWIFNVQPLCSDFWKFGENFFLHRRLLSAPHPVFKLEPCSSLAASSFFLFKWEVIKHEANEPMTGKGTVT